MVREAWGLREGGFSSEGSLCTHERKLYIYTVELTQSPANRPGVLPPRDQADAHRIRSCVVKLAAKDWRLRIRSRRAELYATLMGRSGVAKDFLGALVIQDEAFDREVGSRQSLIRQISFM